MIKIRLTYNGNSVTINAKMILRPKIKNLMDVVGQRAKAGEFILLPHAISRKSQREISVADITRTLLTGWHESSKDEYKAEYAAWNYAIRGKTIDERKLRIVVSFDENQMLVITVIKITR